MGFLRFVSFMMKLSSRLFLPRAVCTMAVVCTRRERFKCRYHFLGLKNDAQSYQVNTVNLTDVPNRAPLDCIKSKSPKATEHRTC